MKKKKPKLANEGGEIVIESIIVIVVTIFLVFFLMNMVIVVYNQQFITTTANRTASDVAAVYSNSAKDPFYGYMGSGDFDNNSPYRYWSPLEQLSKKNKQKAKWYACFYLTKWTIGEEPTDLYSGVTVTVGKNKLKERTINVKIEEKYSAFTLNPLVVFDFDPQYTVVAEANAVCLDPIHDMNVYKFQSELYDAVEKSNKVTRIATAIYEMIQKIIELSK